MTIKANFAKASLVLVAALTLGACAGPQMVGRAAGALGETGLVAGPRVSAAYDVAQVVVKVPASLEASEQNTFVPRADIVWHGDAKGNRHVQVQSIIQEAATRGTAGMTRGEKVVVEVEVSLFHALTPKARYTFGGNFATRLLLTVKDAQTGAVIDGPRLVVADCPASGGQKALEEEARGLTQRMVIVDHVSGVIAQELATRPAAAVLSRNAFTPSDLGLMQ